MAAGLRLRMAIDQIKFARDYTTQLLDDVADDEWFCMPSEGVTHLAWQVGHLAMAEYALTMLRLRGKEPSDRDFITNDFLRAFKKGSAPVADADAYPPIDEIRRVFDRVHERALAELAECREDDLNKELPEPYALFNTKLGSVFFCAHHEMMHAGQIGLLRRLLGKEPVREKVLIVTQSENACSYSPLKGAYFQAARRSSCIRGGGIRFSHILRTSPPSSSRRNAAQNQ